MTTDRLDAMRTLIFAGREVPAIGMGTWYLGEGRSPASAEADALRAGLDLGLRVIDTAEMYAEGGAEDVVGAALRGRRDDAVIVSKVYPHNASRDGVVAACHRSLARLGVERIDVYLLHWRGGHPLAETVEGFEALLADGAIGAWGVSNLDPGDLAELAGVPGGTACATNQVLYNLTRRGPELDLFPQMARVGMPVMAYSPIEQGRLFRPGAGLAALQAVAARHDASPAQVALAWTIRSGDVLSIPKASNPAHLRDNVGALTLELTGADLADLDAAFPAPVHPVPLQML